MNVSNLFNVTASLAAVGWTCFLFYLTISSIQDSREEERR